MSLYPQSPGHTDLFTSQAAAVATKPKARTLRRLALDVLQSSPDGMTADEYRPIAGFPGYRVGSDGSVWTCKKQCGGLTSFWRQMKARPTSVGYPGVTLCKENIKHSRTVHVLVLEAFVGPRPKGMFGCHADGSRTNNHLSNLRWDTPTANEADKLLHGRRCFGEKNAAAKLREADVIFIRKSNVGAKEIARQFGMSPRSIWEIRAGATWQHLLAS